MNVISLVLVKLPCLPFTDPGGSSPTMFPPSVQKNSLTYDPHFNKLLNLKEKENVKSLPEEH